VSVLPVRIDGAEGVAFEDSFQQGVKRESLRSLCRVVNATKLPLEVALTKLEPANQEAGALIARRAPPQVNFLRQYTGCLQGILHRLPSLRSFCTGSFTVRVLDGDSNTVSQQFSCCTQGGASSSRDGPSGSVLEIEVYENERYLPLKGWGSNGHLLPTDRSKYSLGRRNAKSQMDFPVFPLPQGTLLLRCICVLHAHPCVPCINCT